MINRCRKCNAVLLDGNKVTVEVETTYHAIPSKVFFSISNNFAGANGATLQHVDCEGETE